MADAITGNTQLGATKADIIAAMVLKELQFKSVLKPLVTDYSALAVKGAKSVALPSFGSFSVTNRATATQGDATVLTAATDVINLDKNSYISWIIDSTDAVQSSVEVQQLFAERAGSAMARYFDEQVLAVLESDAGYNQGAATAVTRDIVLDLREYLLSKNADPMNMSMVIGVDQEKELLKITEFSNAQVYGQPVIPNGMIGKVFGVPVYVHSGLAAAKVYMFDKAGIAAAVQRQPAYSEQGANEFGTGAKRAALDMVWGVDSLYRGQFGAAAGTSPLIAKM